MSRPPQLLRSIICDDVRHEVGGKVSLMGVFSNFSVVNLTLGAALSTKRPDEAFRKDSPDVKQTGPRIAPAHFDAAEVSDTGNSPRTSLRCVGYSR